MASPICTKPPTAEEVKGLKTICNALFIVNERVGEAELQRVRLMSMKYTWYGCADADREEFSKYNRQVDKYNLHTEDWLAWARDHKIFDSLDLLNAELEKANASKAEHESIQAALRLSADNLSRPYLRSLTILDLPDEILLEIFEALEGFNHDWDALMPPFLFVSQAKIKAIKNARLVCRQFCRLSSQFLVHVVPVTPTETSLARLDEISRHPTISKGVRDVQIIPHLHSPRLADLDDFVSFLAYHVGQSLEVFDQTDRLGLWKTTEQALAETVTNGHKFESMLRRHLAAIDIEDPDPDNTDSGGKDEDDDNNFARVRGIHAHYKLILEEEQSLIQSGRFSRSIGLAIARMSPGRSLRRLHVDDTIHNWWSGLLDPRVNICETAKTFMLQPLPVHTRMEYGFDLPDYGFIVPLIDAVRGAGVMLDSIHLNLSSLGKRGGLVLDPNVRAQFSSGMQQLRRFSFSLRDHGLRRNILENLQQFLSACADAPSLEKLWISTGSRRETVDVGEILGSRSRLNLREASFSSVALDASKLKVMLEELSEPMKLLMLRDVDLRNGTWKQSLDVLRGRCKLILEKPSGAECKDMSPEEYEDVFGIGSDDYGMRQHNSAAEIYVNNPDSTWCKTNPIQALEEKRLSSGNDD